VQAQIGTVTWLEKTVHAEHAEFFEVPWDVTWYLAVVQML